MGSYAIRSTSEPIQAISFRKPARSFENRDAFPSGAANASSQSLEMSIPMGAKDAAHLFFPFSCACHASLNAHVFIQDVGKDGGDQNKRLPQAEGLVRVRRQACSHKPAPAPSGRSQPAIPCREARPDPPRRAASPCPRPPQSAASV